MPFVNSMYKKRNGSSTSSCCFDYYTDHHCVTNVD
jgi:hypothetical protein